MSVPEVDTLSLAAVEARRERPEPTAQVMFQVKGLYGFSREGVRVPLSAERSIDSGPVALTLDPEAPAAGNVGIVDFGRRKLRVRYSVQLVFPGLYDLVTSREYEPELLTPVRAVATDECEVTDAYDGWRALGRMDFLPGSFWSGAGGG